MSETEFDIWVAYHTTAFPAVARWIGENESTIPFWQRTLADTDLVTAKQATDAMHSGDLEQPRAYQDHPQRVRRWVRDAVRAHEKLAKTRRTIDGDQTFECAMCEDRGTVQVFHPMTAKDICRDEDFADVRWRTCVVACTCEVGQVQQRERKLPGGTRIRPLVAFAEYMVQCEGRPNEREKRECWDAILNREGLEL
jgi:hypothetical protein